MAERKTHLTISDEKIDAGPASKPRYRVATRPDGTRVRIRMLDATGETFTADLLASFKANVRKARKESRAAGVKV